MKNTLKMRLLFMVLLGMSSQAVFAAQPDHRLDGVWVGTEKLSIAKRTDFPKPIHETLPAKIAVARGGTLLAVVEGYSPGRYMNLHWSGDTLVFEISNMRKGELRLSPGRENSDRKRLCPAQCRDWNRLHRPHLGI